MNLPLLSLEVRQEPDVLLARQRARQIAGLLGFAPLDQTRIATAVSEVARHAFHEAGGGRVEFRLDTGATPTLFVRVRERGPGLKDLRAILGGADDPQAPLGGSVLGAKRLMDGLEVQSSEVGTTLVMAKRLPKQAPPPSPKDLARISAELAKQTPQDLQEELQSQNQELLRALQELRDRQAELAELHARELEETNRGVVALYSELDESANQLKRISDLKSRFLSNMSHEFRSPLNTILSMSGFLLDGSSGELSAEQRKEIGFIRKAAEGLQLLVNDLLDLAKVEAGKAVIRVEPFEVAELFEALRGTTLPLLAQGDVALVVEPPVGVPALLTDEGKVVQILRNFLSNAAKFTERGEIRLAAKAGPGDTVVFSVKDTGIGIGPEDQPRIFEEFSQVEGPVQKRVKGTGLGLPLSKKLAELLGGTVSVQSEPGAGSTFFAAIPRRYAAADEPAAEPNTPSLPDPLLSPVLVVEDDPVVLMLYERHLEGSGFQVIPARTLDEARRALVRMRPAAVLLDILLDAESGWTLLAEMKETPDTKDIPIFVLTVVDGEERALALGAADFGVKPIGRDWLLRRLNSLKQQGPLDTILIIDDDAADRYRLRGLLTALGRFDIVEAESGAEGLRLAGDVCPDAIFLDLVLSDMNGFEILEHLKLADATRDLPVIINTSTSLGDDERKRLAPATAAILSKSPATTDEAFTMIRDALIRAGLNLVPAAAES